MEHDIFIDENNDELLKIDIVIFQSYVKVLEFSNRFLSSFLGMLRLGLSPPESEDWIWENLCTGIPFTKRQYSRISRRVPSKMNWTSTLHNDCQLVWFLMIFADADSRRKIQESTAGQHLSICKKQAGRAGTFSREISSRKSLCN